MDTDSTNSEAPEIDLQTPFMLMRNGVQTGPFGVPLLGDMLVAGLISQEDLIWRQGMAGWSRVGDIFAIGTGSEASVSEPEPSATDTPPEISFQPESSGSSSSELELDAEDNIYTQQTNEQDRAQAQAESPGEAQEVEEEGTHAESQSIEPSHREQPAAGPALPPPIPEMLGGKMTLLPLVPLKPANAAEVKVKVEAEAITEVKAVVALPPIPRPPALPPELPFSPGLKPPAVPPPALVSVNKKKIKKKASVGMIVGIILGVLIIGLVLLGMIAGYLASSNPEAAERIVKKVIAWSKGVTYKADDKVIKSMVAEMNNGDVITYKSPASLDGTGRGIIFDYPASCRSKFSPALGYSLNIDVPDDLYFCIANLAATTEEFSEFNASPSVETLRPILTRDNYAIESASVVNLDDGVTAVYAVTRSIGDDEYSPYNWDVGYHFIHNGRVLAVTIGCSDDAEKAYITRKKVLAAKPLIVAIGRTLQLTPLPQNLNALQQDVIDLTSGRSHVHELPSSPGINATDMTVTVPEKWQLKEKGYPSADTFLMKLVRPELQASILFSAQFDAGITSATDSNKLKSLVGEFVQKHYGESVSELQPLRTLDVEGRTMAEGSYFLPGKEPSQTTRVRLVAQCRAGVVIISSYLAPGSSTALIPIEDQMRASKQLLDQLIFSALPSTLNGSVEILDQYVSQMEANQRKSFSLKPNASPGTTANAGEVTLESPSDMHLQTLGNMAVLAPPQKASWVHTISLDPLQEGVIPIQKLKDFKYDELTKGLKDMLLMEKILHHRFDYVENHPALIVDVMIDRKDGQTTYGEVILMDCGANRLTSFICTYAPKDYAAWTESYINSLGDLHKKILDTIKIR